MALVLLSALVFGATLLLFLGIAGPAAAVNRTARARALAPNAVSESPLGPLVRFMAALADRPWLEAHTAALSRKLAEAGRPGGISDGLEFLGVATTLGVVAGGGVLVLLALAGGIGAFALLFSLAIAAVATWLAHAWLDGEVADRRSAIARQLPFFLDLAVMCMEAGASLQETMEIYVRDNPDDALAEEFRIVQAEVRMGRTLAEAMESLIQRIQVDSLHTTVDAILQGQRLGTSLGKVLRDQAEVQRFKRSQLAERKAEELKVRMQGPVILMMIAVFVLILGPAVLKVTESGIF
jgi:tight adherence protein C